MRDGYVRDDRYYGACLEANIFERLAAEAPEKIPVFAQFIRSMRSEIDDAQKKRAKEAGKEARRNGIGPNEALINFLNEMVSQPDAQKLYFKRQQCFNLLCEAGGISPLVSEMTELLRDVVKEDDCALAFWKGYYESHKPEMVSKKTLKELIKKQLASARDSATKMLEEGPQYTSAVELSEHTKALLNKNLSEEGKAAFSDYVNAHHAQFVLEQNYCFIQGAIEAFNQHLKPSTNEVENEETETFYHLDDIYLTEDYHALNKRVIESSARLEELLGSELRSLEITYYESAYAVNFDMQDLLFLLGYRIGVMILSECIPNYQENLQFSDLLEKRIHSFLTLDRIGNPNSKVLRFHKSARN